MADNKEDDNNKKENQRPDPDLRENDTITTISIGVAKNDEENKDKDEFCEDECCTAVEICEDECCTAVEICEDECCAAEADEENGIMTSVEFDQLLESQNGKENNQNGEQESGPDEGRSRFFSLAQITVKMSDLFESVKERVFGDDYWIPSDPFEVAEIKPDLLASHKILYPAIEKIGEMPLVVIQGTIKKDPPVKLNHVVYTCAPEDGCSKKRYFTIFRSRDMEEALDFCRRCEECRVLFRLFDQKMDIRKSIWDITYMMKNHPLWRMVHIAIYCQRMDIFTDDGLKYLKKFGYTENDLTKVPCSPEGKHPLLMAVEKNQEAIVKFLLKIGADPTLCDPAGNNAWHYAALVSKEMLEILWSVEGCRPFLNAKNNNGDTATRIAFQNLNPYCLKMLMAFGGEMLIKTTDKNPLFELMQSKGKTIEMIRILLETSPGIYKERDAATGNTCLHATLYKTSLMGLLHLKHRELDLNAKNKAGLTPLHQFVIRGDLGLVMCLASYGADLNVKADGSNMTALHMAVSQKNLDITRFLLCLGADPNQINSQGDTPRHLAAKLNAIEFLKSLIICGATRCPSSKVSCVTGCVDEKFLQILKKPSSMPAMPTPATVTKSPTSLVQEFENRIFAKEQQRYNKVLDSEHDAIYDEMINMLNEMAANPGDSNVINVLSLDGGGIRGLVITQILIEVERMMGESVFQYFDWVAGTSTGSIVSAGLASGQTLRQIQRIYMRFKDLVFEARRPHNTMVLETFIQEEMGKDKLLSDIKWPRLVFTTTRADFFPVQLELMRNYKLPASDEENAELGFKNAEGLLLWKALRRSSAAPTYFSAVDDKYIDGGIIANNPTLELMHEIQFWNSFNKLKNLPNSVRIGCVLSVGTGSIPPTALAPSHLEIAQNYLTQPITSYNAVLTIGQILVDQVTATEGAPVVRAGTWCISQRTPYFRLSAPLHKDIQMDAKDDAEIARMMWDSMEYIYKHKDYVERLCILLRKVGKAWNRRHLFPQQESKDGQKMQDQQTQTSNPPSPVKELRK